jgi:intracellular multiplication protein IcmL
MSAKDALVLAISRNAFYRRLHVLLLAAVSLNVAAIFVLTFLLSYLLMNPTRPLYFATDEVSRLINIVPVNLPNMSTQDVTAWTVKAVQDAYSYDYINYHEQLQNAEKYFTRAGWSTYMKALMLSGNMRALTNRKQVVLAQVIETPKVLKEAMLNGSLAWLIEMPLLVIYTMPPYDGSNQFSNALVVRVIVQRQQILEGDNGLGIAQLIAAMPAAATTNTNQMQQ